jgi:uncharacterized protein (DUF302 family)
MYGYSKKVEMGFNEAVEKTKEALSKEGFGILSEIDVKKTLRAKLDVDYDDYIILGACNPPFAYKALETEKEVGLLLPCNIIAYRNGGDTFVSAILPTAAMSIVDNDVLEDVAVEVETKLKKVVDSI